MGRPSAKGAPVDHADRAAAAASLLGAYNDGHPVEPLTEKYSDLTLDDAYAIQLLQIDERLRAGATVKGHKVGLTSAAMQKQLGVDQPDFGHLLEGMFHIEHTAIPADIYLQPRIEPEIAFILRRPLKGPGVTAAEAIAAVDFVLPALEIIDSRIRDWRIGILDTVADNASSGGVVLGSHPTALADVDLRLVACALYVCGEPAGNGVGGAVLGSPLNALVWLANTLGGRGIGLEAGHVVLPGSVMAAVPVSPGDVVTASFTGLGSVTARFAGSATAKENV
ncbi:2-keto-4-pentenoate hydratase [Nocardia aurea]|uniref:2-keto-4-pentenoate hydratase n=1 Tax=Nocardia aurea TaxID=2144174 RepID=UPI000D69D4DD|nr:fumarylacetoacetate hydrolase family protein [Nocardia aurea]